MHRTWEFPIENRRRNSFENQEASNPSLAQYHGPACDMHGDKNELRVVLHSPLKYIREENKKIYTGGSMECTEGFPHLRKAHCMLGWDWGPRLPDAGIFRAVELLAVKKARLESVYVSQYHEKGGNPENAEGSKSESQRFSNTLPEQRCKQTFTPACVELDFDVTVELFGEEPDDTEIEIEVTAPDGTVYRPGGEEQQAGACPEISGVSSDNASDNFKVRIPNPLLWWPHGYGAQPLYRAKVTLKAPDGEVFDVWEKRIGLRTMTVNTDADEWGNCFAHEVNGVKIFAMGADYIPEDNILSRVTRGRTRRLLEDAVAANHNCIRVWGGGYYRDDYFYDICDELGLIVWQDFMFACASYELDDEFEANVTAELRDNVRRLRHHACLGLWCGNNEMETQTLDKAWRPSEKQTYDYIKLFEYIIPKLLKEEDPHTFYWPSSPSSGGNYDNPWDENRGDTHYWDVWHGNKPFTEYRKFRFRYLSEFGFQSFPCLKTVESFTEPGDRNIFSRVMEMHQRNRAANGKILNYLSATYLYPKDFESLLYASQLLQADAIRYGVEHFRRHRGRCMGAVVWQLNDIWPVASWASIDYYGRWKALHYVEKRMFAPVMISCEEKGEISERPYCIAEPAPMEISARLHVANETMREISGEVRWSLRNPDSSILREGGERVMVPALSGVWLDKMDFRTAMCCLLIWIMCL
ncbi:MAG: glycoside hydrolase family 2 protein [Lachnospiraceae bacterium]|nr:glycoside hydrolase family 2 protein [Lachnospiraceae bacterium]